MTINRLFERVKLQCRIRELISKVGEDAALEILKEALTTELQRPAVVKVKAGPKEVA